MEEDGPERRGGKPERDHRPERSEAQRSEAQRSEERSGVEGGHRSVSLKGQVTIPAEIRRLLGVGPGDKVSFSVRNGQVEVHAVRPPLDESFQAIPALSPRRSWKEIERLAAEEQAERVGGEGLE